MTECTTGSAAWSARTPAATTVPASSRGHDAGTKMPGRKRHIVVDCLGLLPAVMVTTASLHDSNAAVPLLERLRGRYKKCHCSVNLRSGCAVTCGLFRWAGWLGRVSAQGF
ncbi:transposase [Streptomyces sp. NPDC006393]|uniref:transposase n=1 Tax=Streptomyces sp. NPDC006393 TaxID=3156763 RepID=UPI0033DD8A60